jgi:hypothetical protein
MSSTPSSSIDPAPEAKPEPTRDPGSRPKSGSILSVALTLGLLALLVWGFSPHRVRVKPTPIEPVPPFCAPSKADFVPSNLTDVPDVSSAGLPDVLKNHILLRLNMEPCTCGCALSLASCRAGNPQCSTSPQAINAVVKEEQATAGQVHSVKPASPR